MLVSTRSPRQIAIGEKHSRSMQEAHQAFNTSIDINLKNIIKDSVGIA